MADGDIRLPVEDTGVFLEKIASVVEQRIMGRITGGTVTGLTAAQVKTLIAIVEADITTADNTTLDVSTSKHGFVPKAPNNTNSRLGGAASWVQETRRVELQITDDATAVTTGDGKIIWVVPAFLTGFNLVGVESVCTTVSSSGTPEIQIHNLTDTQDMLSTRLTIDANEYTSATAATAAVINTTYDDVATGDRLRVDVDTAGTGTKGLLLRMYFEKP
jgi:hypothetical protein